MRRCCLLICLLVLLGSSASGENVFSLSALPGEEAEGFMLKVVSVQGAASEDAPRIYIYHTHTCEAYNPADGDAYTPTEKWRTADNEHNVVQVGEKLALWLSHAGFQVYHDTADYEHPDLSTAYARSLEALEKTLDKPYDLYIDIHRDSYSVGNGANEILQDGKSYARVLFLVGKGTGQTVEEEKPDWQRNEQIAQVISDGMNALVPDISRGISMKSGRYNQHAAPCCVLLEVGNNQNTLTQAMNAMEPLTLAICRYFDALD